MPVLTQQPIYQTALSLMLGTVIISANVNAATAEEDPQTAGAWESVPMPSQQTLAQAVHTVLLPNGKVLIANGSSFRNTIVTEGDTQKIQEGVDSGDYDSVNNTVLFDPQTAEFVKIPSPPAVQHQENNDLFCAGHLQQADGNVLFVGGTGRYYPGGRFTGSRQLNLYNWRDNTWSDKGQLKEGRWYPSLVPLADGKIAIFSGLKLNEPNQINQGLEIYDPLLNKLDYFDLAQIADSPFNTKLEGSSVYDSIDLYPRVFPTATGKLLITGDEAGIANVLTPHSSKKSYLMAVTKDTGGKLSVSFEVGADKAETSKAYGTAFQVPNSEDVVLLGGLTGTNDIGFGLPNKPDIPGASVASSLQRWQAPGKTGTPSGQWSQTPAFLAEPRANLQAVILPDKEVLVVNGGVYPEYCPVYEPLLLSPNPQANGGYDIKRMKAAHLPRLYHNGALLLPDARVLIIGGNANRAARDSVGNIRVDTIRDAKEFNVFAKLTDQAGQPKAFTLEEFYQHPQSYYAEGDTQPFVPAEIWQAEIFSPPYLFKPGVRPEIVQAPEFIKYNQTGLVTVSAAEAAGDLVLVKLGSVTHSFDYGQRLVDLPIAIKEHKAGSAIIKFNAPSNANLYPPGYYMMFYLNAAGKPSHAKMVRLES